MGSHYLVLATRQFWRKSERLCKKKSTCVSAALALGACFDLSMRWHNDELVVL